MVAYVCEISPVRWLAALVRNCSPPPEALNKTAVIAVFIPDPHRPPLKQRLGESWEQYQNRFNDTLLGYELEWKKIVPDVMDAIFDKSEDDDKVCFVWAEGPMETAELPAVFPYITNRYHIEGVTFTHKKGYRYSWISFEYYKESFVEMIEECPVNFELTRLHLMVFNEQHIDTVITKEPPYCIIDLDWLIDHSAVAVSFFDHFEGCYIAGEKTLVDAARKRVVDRLRSQNVDVNIMESAKS